MYGLIYFKEDNTLSVVSEHSRNLKLTSNFVKSADCVMKWSGKNFEGVILQTSNSENEMNKLCKKLALFVKETSGKPLSVTTLLNRVEAASKEEGSKCSKKQDKKKNHNHTNSKEKEEKAGKEGAFSRLLKENSSQTLNDVWEQINSSLRVINGDENDEEKLKSSYALNLLKQAKSGAAALLDTTEKLLNYLDPMIDKTCDQDHGNANSHFDSCYDDGSAYKDNNHVIDLDNQYAGISDVNKPSCSSEEQVYFHENTDMFHKQQYFQESQQPVFHTQPMVYMQGQANQPMTVYTPLQRYQQEMQQISNMKIQESHHTPPSSESRKREIDISESETEDVQQGVTDLRRSPRKKLFSSGSSSGSSPKKQMVKLMKNSDVMVDSYKLKKARQAAFKHQKPAYTLMSKLMPCLFTREEMANSRGQGLGPAKQGDTRPILDPLKIKLCKDYVEAWLKETNLSGQGEIELNQAVTQQVDTARKGIRQKKQ